MLATRQPVLRHFWYPVIPLEALDDGPRSFRLLGNDLVLWLTGDSRVVALADRCCHCQAKLSEGRVMDNRIVCGNHGLIYDETGRCVESPQGLELTREPRVRRYHSETRYGYAWVALDEPLHGIPQFPEADDMNFRVIPELYEPWHCAGLRVMENGFDNAYEQLSHSNSNGDHQDPMASPCIVENDLGFEMSADVTAWNHDIQPDNKPATIRHITSTWYRPFVRRLQIRYPSGLVHAVVTAATPIDDQQSQICQWAYRNDGEGEVPSRGIVAADRRAMLGDQAILEHTDPNLPLSPDAERAFQMPADHPALIMRKQLRTLLVSHGETEANDPSGSRFISDAAD